MARFNTKDHTNKKSSAIATTGETARNHYGAQGFKRDQKSDLYLLAVSFMGGDKNYYESSDERYQRLISLTGAIAVEDPEWLTEMIRWVRNGAYMRTVAGVMAVEAVMARLAFARVQDEKYRTSQKPGVNAAMIDAACARADEPGEILAYYLSKWSKPIPNPIEKGLEMAVQRLYTQRGFLRYGGTTTKSITMQDVLRLSHAKADPEKPDQNALFSYITNPGQGAEDLNLAKIATRNRLMAVPQHQRRMLLDTEPTNALLRQGEMGWEHISAWLGSMDKEAWEAVIPGMGVMAMLRNLRNFDQVGISDAHVRMVTDTISNVDEVRQARALPMRFLSAYRNAPSLRWAWPLEQGLNHSLQNVPEIGGRNLILVDVSPSMTWGKISDKSQLSYYDAAAIFGAVMAVRNPHSHLVQFGGDSKIVPIAEGESVLKVIEKFHEISYTNIPAAVEKWFGSHDRVIIVTDEQSSGWGNQYAQFMEVMRNVRSIVPAKVPVYTWNLAGFGVAHQPANVDNMHVFGGGFSDAAFGMIKFIENGAKASWPWEVDHVDA